MITSTVSAAVRKKCRRNKPMNSAAQQWLPGVSEKCQGAV
jgi:hypothetical protein